MEEVTTALASVTDRSFDDLLSSTDWLNDDKIRSVMERPLTEFAADYLTKAKSGSRTVDSVAHFHLTNGAIVERINWLADTSERGKAQSYTLMVNYLYDLDKIESNHENYVGHGIVTKSKVVESLCSN